MKKNFFKKLSFVMALAMIISVIAPAAGAFAATGLRLNATSKTLFLGESTKSFNFNPLGMSKGATQKWTSSKPSVATVNAKNGVVTAKATGTTTITATITNAKKTVTKKLTAKVTVGDNIKTLSVAVPAGADAAKLAVGTDYKLATSYVTKSGAKSKTTNTFVWSVDKEGATVSKTGVFNATVPGEYTVTVTANRYKNVKVADATIKVTVLNAVKEVKQTAMNTFTVEFAGAVTAADLTTTSASVAQVVNGKDLTTGAEKIKSVTLDATGKVATVVLYADFVAKSTYKFVYGDLTGTFIAASKDLKEVKGIVFDDLTVNVTTNTGKDVLDSIYAINADGVKILSGSEIASFLSFEVATAEQTKGYVDATGKAYIYAAGNSITAKATYTNYVYNDETKKYDSVIVSDSAVINGVSSDVDTTTFQFAVTTASSHPATLAKAWTSPISVSLGEATSVAPFNIYTRYKKTTDSSTDDYTYASAEFTYVSTDPAKLTINGTTLYPVALGTVTVIVKSQDGKKVLGNFDVTINPERVLTTAAANTTETVGNNSGVGEKKTVVITVLDNLGADMKGGELSATAPTLVSAPQSGTGVSSINFAAPATGNAGKVEITFDARGSRAGYYQYKTTLTDTTTKGTVTKDVVFGVNVVESNTLNNTAVSYVPVFEDGSLVTKTNANVVDVNSVTNYTVAVYGLNGNGYRVTLVPTVDYTAEIKLGANVVSGSSLNVSTLTGGALSFLDTGVYTLTAKANSVNSISKPANAPLGASSFNLTDTHVKSVVATPSVKTSSTVTNIAQVLDKALDVTITAKDNVARVDFINNPLDVVQVVGVYQTSVSGNLSLTTSVTSQTYLYIEKIVVAVDVDGVGGSVAKKLYTIDVNRSIAIQ
jgi:hypothetical protein